MYYDTDYDQRREDYSERCWGDWLSEQVFEQEVDDEY